MAYSPFGKITVYASDPNANNFTENVGYTTANVTNDSIAASAIKTFGQALIGLVTSNSYQKTVVTYEVEVDSINDDDD